MQPVKRHKPHISEGYGGPASLFCVCILVLMLSFIRMPTSVYTFIKIFVLLFCFGGAKSSMMSSTALQASQEARFPISRGFCKLTSPQTHHRMAWIGRHLKDTLPWAGTLPLLQVLVPSLPPARGVVAAPITQQFQSSLMLMSLVHRDPFGIIYIETVFLHAK